jgi:hypothetical protein
MSEQEHKRLRPSGGYRKLRSFQTATIIYDATVSFCDRFIDKRSRTIIRSARVCRRRTDRSDPTERAEEDCDPHWPKRG